MHQSPSRSQNSSGGSGLVADIGEALRVHDEWGRKMRSLARGAEDFLIVERFIGFSCIGGNTEPGVVTLVACALAVDDAEQADILQKPRGRSLPSSLETAIDAVPKALVDPHAVFLRAIDAAISFRRGTIFFIVNLISRELDTGIDWRRR